MSAIRNFALVAVAAAALAGSAQAQRPARGRDRGDEVGPLRSLNLTEAQKTQIKAIHTKYEAQLKASRDQAKPYMEAARAARQKGDTAAARTNLEKARQVASGVRQQEMNEIRGVLTPAQRAQADSLMAQRARNGGRGFGPGGMKGERGERGGALKSLDLTDAQKTQIKAIRAKYKGQANASREQEMNEVRAVLTPDQRAKFDAAQADRKQNGGAHRGRGGRGGRGGRRGQGGRGMKPNRGF